MKSINPLTPSPSLLPNLRTPKKATSLSNPDLMTHRQITSLVLARTGMSLSRVLLRMLMNGSVPLITNSDGAVPDP